MTDLERLLERVRAEEREECAKVADNGALDAGCEIKVGWRVAGYRTGKLIASAIRARAKLALPQKDSGTGVTPEARSAERP